jgi:preprotein translocase subunit Sss1
MKTQFRVGGITLFLLGYIGFILETFMTPSAPNKNYDPLARIAIAGIGMIVIGNGANDKK